MNNREYQFQVAVIAEIGEVFVTGERSQATSLNNYSYSRSDLEYC